MAKRTMPRRTLYTVEEAKRIVEELIETEELIFIQEVRDLSPIPLNEFERLFKTKENRKWLLDKLSQRKSKTKAELRAVFKNSTAAPLLMALYKLNSTDEERRLLSTSFVENENNNKFDGKIEVVMYSGGDVPPIASDEADIDPDMLEAE